MSNQQKLFQGYRLAVILTTIDVHNAFHAHPSRLQRPPLLSKGELIATDISISHSSIYAPHEILFARRTSTECPTAVMGDDERIDDRRARFNGCVRVATGKRVLVITRRQ